MGTLRLFSEEEQTWAIPLAVNAIVNYETPPQEALGQAQQESKFK